ncbi:hypothetical protein BDN71DRAFT_809990 [Pleurotus eryngii]|uniref:Uncharacterized protein n=1 Tax=Pleurotus eryngii TaxID=5323 RepID=A0A9P6A156_PLEER|nr:hypothetical protein BDN71DRAFT_809990 [Pleurotus eryngii]
MERTSSGRIRPDRAASWPCLIWRRRRPWTETMKTMVGCRTTPLMAGWMTPPLRGVCLRKPPRLPSQECRPREASETPPSTVSNRLWLLPLTALLQTSSVLPAALALRITPYSIWTRTLTTWTSIRLPLKLRRHKRCRT